MEPLVPDRPLRQDLTTWADRFTVAVYAAALLVGAVLLFAVQPLCGRLLLPLLGGAPAVWNSCLVFFQACLLAGYLYAHGLVRWLPLPAQIGVHAGLLVCATTCCRLEPPARYLLGSEASPWLAVLSALGRSAAVPVVAVSATAPLLQQWFASGRHPSAKDPYFLYGASNAGSLLGLVAYPVLIEPFLPLAAQLGCYTGGLVLLSGLGLCAATLVLLRPRTDLGRRSEARPASGRPQVSLRRQCLPWTLLAALPSVLLQAVTTFITTDVAAVPLLWVLPLGLYLVSFVLAFARRPLVARTSVLGWVPKAVLLVGLLTVAGITQPLVTVLPAHLAAFFLLCWACHAELASRRPPASLLTKFYLVVAGAGSIGGLLGALVAPRLLNSLLEYPLTVAAIASLWALASPPDQNPVDWKALAGEQKAVSEPRRLLGLVRQPLLVLGLACLAVWSTRRVEPPFSVLVAAPVSTLGCVLAYCLSQKRPRAFAVASAALLLVPFLLPPAEQLLLQRRTFFGVHRVFYDREHHRHVYAQGTTIHGLQSRLPGQAKIAGAYFHPTGPAGEVFALLHTLRGKQVGLVGLGVGSLAAYAEPGDRFRFFELDPTVAEIAENRVLFSFLADARARGARIEIAIGDGRRELEREPAASLDLLVIDAYASDVVPLHLLTREAFVLYRQRLKPEGLALLNVSNRYLDLGRVVAATAREAGLTGRQRLDRARTAADRVLVERDGKAASRWMVLSASPARLSALGLGPEWQEIAAEGGPVWTDDYASILNLLL